ncbi:hypothetical protein RN001_015975 [Aquatica leii]|uniref:Uncharacterized protein n=1 Tax=Aquatica leii TaxID=1421715 RepID=A0AAN7P147_9COLE|nr:hypothetical protein RN001_015975 [Aquatica leii]
MLLYKRKGKYAIDTRMGLDTELTIEEEEHLVNWFAILKFPNLTKLRSDVTEVQIRNWFVEVSEYLKTHQLNEVVKDPRRVYNADETAVFLAPKSTKCLVKKAKVLFLDDGIKLYFIYLYCYLKKLGTKNYRKKYIQNVYLQQTTVNSNIFLIETCNLHVRNTFIKRPGIILYKQKKRKLKRK